MKRLLGIVLAAMWLTACGGGDPGPLKGTWRMDGALPMTVHFRNGETEAMGMIEKVSYETRGESVLVKYESGLMKGTALRYQMKGKDLALSELGTLRRVR